MPRQLSSTWSQSRCCFPPLEYMRCSRTWSLGELTSSAFVCFRCYFQKSLPSDSGRIPDPCVYRTRVGLACCLWTESRRREPDVRVERTELENTGGFHCRNSISRCAFSVGSCAPCNAIRPDPCIALRIVRTVRRTTMALQTVLSCSFMLPLA